MENKYLNFGDWGMRKEEVTPPFSPHWVRISSVKHFLGALGGPEIESVMIFGFNHSIIIISGVFEVWGLKRLFFEISFFSCLQLPKIAFLYFTLKIANILPDEVRECVRMLLILRGLMYYLISTEYILHYSPGNEIIMHACIPSSSSSSSSSIHKHNMVLTNACMSLPKTKDKTR